MKKLAALLIAAVSAWIYLPCIRGAWLWDDGLEVAQNAALREAGGWWRPWVHPQGMDYFPLKGSLQWLEWHLWGANPAGYHLVNLGLHIVSALLVWRLLRLLGIRCAALGGRQEQAEVLGAALQNWIWPVFSRLEPVFENGRDETLAAAVCRLADFGARLHPDHRADLVFDQVLRAPVPGMNHPERAFLACAAFARHTAANVTPGARTTERLLSDAQLQRARALGAALRLGCDLSGRSPALLARSHLRFDKSRVILSAEPQVRDLLLGEQTARRSATLAGLLERELRIEE